MFTGIIKATGQIRDRRASGGNARLFVASAGLPWLDYAIGDSIAVNGVCLTAVRLHADGFETDVSAETLSVTTLGVLRAGSPVNLEPALAVGDRLGGHIVSGHVDGEGRVRTRKADAGSELFEIELPAELARYVARKGSIAVDGVSLTINKVSANVVGLTIIPHTINETIISNYRPGTAVNIEVDMMARYAARLLGADGGISTEFLKANGYG